MEAPDLDKVRIGQVWFVGGRTLIMRYRLRDQVPAEMTKGMVRMTTVDGRDFHINLRQVQYIEMYEEGHEHPV